MTKLIWDQVGERIYETGVDRGVLYLSDGEGVPWNGLLSVEDVVEEADITPYYIDGVRYFNQRSVGDYSGVLKAFTYPDEFMQFDGYDELTVGLYASHQPVTKTFGLSYRTMVGNDILGREFGYKIHLVYNLVATPSTRTYGTVTSSVDALDLTWNISGVPVEIPGFRPAVHFVIDSRALPVGILSDIEDLIYGTDISEPRIPSPVELMGMIFNVVDNHDGSWTATGSDEVIILPDATSFEITWPGAVYIDGESYTLSNTPEED